jgi:hypothetical protein
MPPWTYDVDTVGTQYWQIVQALGLADYVGMRRIARTTVTLVGADAVVNCLDAVLMGVTRALASAGVTG